MTEFGAELVGAVGGFPLAVGDVTKEVTEVTDVVDVIEELALFTAAEEASRRLPTVPFAGFSAVLTIDAEDTPSASMAPIGGDMGLD